MKIAAVTDSYHPTSDGVVVAVDTYTKALKTVGIESEIVAPDPGSEKDRIEGVRYFRSVGFKSYPGYFIPIFPSNKVQVFREINPDVVHIHGITVMALKGLIAAHHLKIPVVVTFHTMVGDTMKYYSPVKIPQETAEKLVWKYIGYFTRWVDAIVAPSQAVANELKANGIKTEDIRVIPTPIDTSRFSPGEGREEIREKYGLQGKRVIACVGRVSFEKEIDTLIRAISQMDDDIVLFIVGKGPAMDSLKELCQQLHLEDRVVFAGYQSGEDLVKCYRAADMAATASRFETQCFVALEAMACGLPVACANARALADYVKDGENGFLFNNSVEECIEALKKGLEAGDDIRENAMATAKEFSVETFTSRMSSLYNDVIERKKR
jgi:1,2-diacylglycerol 3-alpha-glucosyltransferase